MSQLTSFDRVCRPRATMAKHARRCRPCVLPKGDDGMPRPTSFDCVCCTKVVMQCHARRRSIVCVVQTRCWHATPDIVRPCLPSKGDNGMPLPTLPDRLCCPKVMMACHAQRRSIVCDGMSRLTLFDRVCCPRAIMACHARRRSTVCAAQR